MREGGGREEQVVRGRGVEGKKGVGCGERGGGVKKNGNRLAMKMTCVDCEMF